MKSLAVCGLLILCITAAAAAPRSTLAPNLSLHIRGQGPVVVFESGLGEPHDNWDKVVAPLASCLTTVTYDRQGIGQSVLPQDATAPVLAAVVAKRLLAALRARGLRGPYLLVGHSIGGLYVQALARNDPKVVAGIVLVDASSPLEPPNVFVSTVPPKPGSVEAAETGGVAPSVAAMLKGPKLPPVPVVVLAATDHHDRPRREALWRNVQRRTAALSPKGRFELVRSGHFIQKDQPQAVVAAVLSVAAASGAKTAACRR